MQKTTKTKLGKQAREAILRGVNAIYEPVRLTLGPEGGNALLYRTFGRGPRITNDGVTIADVIEPEDEFEQLAAMAFKEAAKRTNERAGDGTTTTVVIGGKLINDIFAALNASDSIRSKTAGGKSGAMKIRRELLAVAEIIKTEIAKRSIKVKDIKDLIKVATVSVEDEELGKTIAEIVFKIGEYGYVDVVEGFKGEIETEVIEGMRFAAKVPAKAFVNNPARYEMVAENCPVVVTNYKIDNAAQVHAFTQHLQTQKLVLIAEGFSDAVLVSMAQAVKQGFFIFPVSAPSLRTDQWHDLSAYMGATCIDKNEGRKLEQIREQHLGFIEKLVVKDTEAREDAVALGGKGAKTDVVAERVKTLQKQIEETRVDSHKKLLERRIASMASSVGVIKVGAPSQAEGLYKKLKIEDAVYACKAAMEEGYVKGGGLCLKEIAEGLPQSVLTDALKAPYEQIQANAEEELKIGKDVIDPAKSVRLAVENAVSVAAHLVTAKIIIPETRERTPAEGYSDIASAIMTYTRYWAKREGLITEGEMEGQKEMMQKYEETVVNDR